MHRAGALCQYFIVFCVQCIQVGERGSVCCYSAPVPESQMESETYIMVLKRILRLENDHETSPRYRTRICPRLNRSRLLTEPGPCSPHKRRHVLLPSASLPAQQSKLRLESVSSGIEAVQP